MPRKPMRSCRHTGCQNLSDGIYCKQHQGEHAREGVTERGYGAKWRFMRMLFLKKHPLCMDCLKRERLTPVTIVDHIVPHRGDERLFWDEGNW